MPVAADQRRVRRRVRLDAEAGHAHASGRREQAVPNEDVIQTGRIVCNEIRCGRGEGDVSAIATDTGVEAVLIGGRAVRRHARQRVRGRLPVVHVGVVAAEGRSRWHGTDDRVFRHERRVGHERDIATVVAQARRPHGERHVDRGRRAGDEVAHISPGPAEGGGVCEKQNEAAVSRNRLWIAAVVGLRAVGGNADTRHHLGGCHGGQTKAEARRERRPPRPIAPESLRSSEHGRASRNEWLTFPRRCGQKQYGLTLEASRAAAARARTRG